MNFSKLALLVISSLCSKLAAQEVVSLFNGKDLTGWQVDVPQHDGKSEVEPAFFVRDEVLVTSGVPYGHLFTEQAYSNYTLTIEYRFPEKAGNCGAMIHCTEPRFLNKLFPRSIEVQMMAGNAGDLIPIGEDITGPRGVSKPKIIGQKKNSFRKNLTEDSEKKIGEWNTMVIHALGDTVVVTVNGDLVNIGTKCSVSQGKIAFQSEGSPVEFRKIELKKISK